jgi:glutamyl-tRNA synthetase
LHIGGLRTALYSYLLAKRTKGQFVLRIEDTDQKRLVPGAEERIVRDLQWAGLQWDEGPDVNGPYGPYRQSERNHIYQEHAQQLLHSGAAYRCFCTPQTTGVAETQYITSGCHQNCSSLELGEAQDRAEVKREPFTVRLRPAYNLTRKYPDLVHGHIQRLKRVSTTVLGDGVNAELASADTILIKSDGTPTYHFANVIDDHLMKITHVIRGSEWMASTPLHYDLYDAFQWTPPQFAHVALLVDKDGAKLSKRDVSDRALDVTGMRETRGILPEALINYVAYLGWSSPFQSEYHDLQRLEQIFDLKFTKGDVVVSLRKLNYFFQKRYLNERVERAVAENSNDPILDTLRYIQDAVTKLYGSDLDTRLPNLAYPDLATYLRDILLIEPVGNKMDVYLARLRPFFEFDPPTEVDSAPSDHVSSIAERMLGPPETREPLPGTDQLSFPQGALNDHIFIVSRSLFRTMDWAIMDGLGIRSSEDLEEKRVEFKAWKGAVSRYLRLRLFNKRPGPLMVHTMAILGQEECCRRMGISSPGGWPKPPIPSCPKARV